MNTKRKKIGLSLLCATCILSFSSFDSYRANGLNSTQRQKNIISFDQTGGGGGTKAYYGYRDDAENKPDIYKNFGTVNPGSDYSAAYNLDYYPNNSVSSYYIDFNSNTEGDVYFYFILYGNASIYFKAESASVFSAQFSFFKAPNKKFPRYGEDYSKFAVLEANRLTKTACKLFDLSMGVYYLRYHPSMTSASGNSLNLKSQIVIRYTNENKKIQINKDIAGGFEWNSGFQITDLDLSIHGLSSAIGSQIQYNSTTGESVYLEANANMLYQFMESADYKDWPYYYEDRIVHYRYSTLANDLSIFYIWDRNVKKLLHSSLSTLYDLVSEIRDDLIKAIQQDEKKKWQAELNLAIKFGEQIYSGYKLVIDTVTNAVEGGIKGTVFFIKIVGKGIFNFFGGIVDGGKYAEEFFPLISAAANLFNAIAQLLRDKAEAEDLNSFLSWLSPIIECFGKHLNDDAIIKIPITANIVTRSEDNSVISQKEYKYIDYSGDVMTFQFFDQQNYLKEKESCLIKIDPYSNSPFYTLGTINKLSGQPGKFELCFKDNENQHLTFRGEYAANGSHELNTDSHLISSGNYAALGSYIYREFYLDFNRFADFTAEDLVYTKDYIPLYNPKFAHNGVIGEVNVLDQNKINRFFEEG